MWKPEQLLSIEPAIKFANGMHRVKSIKQVWVKEKRNRKAWKMFTLVLGY